MEPPNQLARLPRTYPKRVGGLWNQYPEVLHDKWYEYTFAVGSGEIGEGTPPPGWDIALFSFRFDTNIFFPRPKLTQEEKFEIVRTATSREDFHDVDKIISEPRWGRCLCEMRIIAGRECEKYCAKGEDGRTIPEGRQHWAWYIDINPRGLVCPFAMERGFKGDGSAGSWPCDILMDFPEDFDLEEWIMTHDIDDPPGYPSRRIYSDVILPGKCAKCSNEKGYKVDEKTKEIRDPDFANPFTRSKRPPGPYPCESPADSGDYDTSNDRPQDWSELMCVVPVVYKPKERKEDDGDSPEKPHPYYRIGSSYHLEDFRNVKPFPAEEDLYCTEVRKDLATYRNEIIEIESDKSEEDVAPMPYHLRDKVNERRREKLEARDRVIRDQLAHEEEVKERVNEMTRHGL